MIKSVLKSIQLGVLFVAVSASVMARSDDGSSVQLSQLLAGTHSFQANFEQRLSDEDNQIMQQSSGTMIVINSGKLRWQTEQPFAQLVVTDGHKLWRYDEDLEQASVGSFSIDLAQTPAMILSGKVEELDQQYTVTGQIDEQSNGQFTLIPTSTNSLFDSLVIRFNQGRVSAMILLDGFGQTTDIQFSEVVVNAAVNDDLFSFTPPQGTDVLVEQ